MGEARPTNEEASLTFQGIEGKFGLLPSFYNESDAWDVS